MRRLWRWYQQCLATHPVRTQVVSSGILWGLGDIGAQAVTHYSAPGRPRHHQHHAKNPPEVANLLSVQPLGDLRCVDAASLGCCYSRSSSLAGSLEVEDYLAKVGF